MSTSNTVPCNKCFGTGSYRHFGVCFQCQGTGKNAKATVRVMSAERALEQLRMVFRDTRSALGTDKYFVYDLNGHCSDGWCAFSEAISALLIHGQLVELDRVEDAFCKLGVKINWLHQSCVDVWALMPERSQQLVLTRSGRSCPYTHDRFGRTVDAKVPIAC